MMMMMMMMMMMTDDDDDDDGIHVLSSRDEKPWQLRRGQPELEMLPTVAALVGRRPVLTGACSLPLKAADHYVTTTIRHRQCGTSSGCLELNKSVAVESILYSRDGHPYIYDLYKKPHRYDGQSYLQQFYTQFIDA
eukprot:2360555-Amphidinium_carterae.1